MNQSASSLPGAKGVSKDGEQSRPIAGSSFETGYHPPPEKPTSDSFDSQRYASYSYAENSTDYGKKQGFMQSAVDSYGATAQRTQYSADDAEQSIPDPIRTKKKKNLNSSNENLSAAEREELLSKKPFRHEDFSQSEEEVFDLSVEGGAANVPAAIRKKKKKTTKSSRENLNTPESEELLNSSSSYRKESKGVTEESRSSYSASKEHQGSFGGGVSTGISSKPAPPSKKPKPAVPSKPTKQSQQQPPSPSLRVHVRTQPGATVHIHPGSATPPPGYHQLNKSTGSAETDL